MPIVFAQPAPVAQMNEAAYQAGKVQQQNQNAARQQQAWQSAQQNSLHQQSITQQGDALRQRQNEFDASQQPSARDQYMSDQHGQQQMNAINAQQQGHMAETEQRMQMQFTQADNLRLQRIQQGRSAARTAYDNGELSQGEYQEYVSNLDGAQRPLEQMREYSQIQSQRAATRQHEEQGRRMAVQAGTERDYMQRTTLGPPVRTVSDPVTGETFSEIERRPNHWEPLRGGGGAGGTSGSGSGGGGGTTNAYFSAEQHARESHDRSELARVATSGGTPAAFDANAFMQRYQETDATLRQSSYNQNLMANPRANHGPLQSQEQARTALNQGIQQAVARLSGPGNETTRGDIYGLRDNIGGIINLWGTRPQNQWPPQVQRQFSTQMQRLAEIQQSMAASPPSGQPGPGQPTVASGSQQPGTMPPGDVSGAQVRQDAQADRPQGRYIPNPAAALGVPGANPSLVDIPARGFSIPNPAVAMGAPGAPNLATGVLAAPPSQQQAPSVRHQQVMENIRGYGQGGQTEDLQRLQRTIQQGIQGGQYSDRQREHAQAELQAIGQELTRLSRENEQ